MATEKQVERKEFGYSKKPLWRTLGIWFGMMAIAIIVSRTVSPIGIGVISAVFLPWSLFHIWMMTKIKLVIDDAGVSFKDTTGEKSMRWENIDGTASGPIPDNKSHRRYTLSYMGNGLISFTDDVDEAERAFRTVERRVSADLYPKLKAQLEKGDMVAFGPVMLSKGTVAIRQATVRIGECKLHRVDGQVQLQRTTGEVVQTVDEEQVTNLAFLMRLFTELDSATRTGHRVA